MHFQRKSFLSLSKFGTLIPSLREFGTWFLVDVCHHTIASRNVWFFWTTWYDTDLLLGHVLNLFLAIVPSSMTKRFTKREYNNKNMGNHVIINVEHLPTTWLNCKHVVHWRSPLEEAQMLFICVRIIKPPPLSICWAFMWTTVTNLSGSYFLPRYEQ